MSFYQCMTTESDSLLTKIFPSSIRLSLSLSLFEPVCDWGTSPTCPESLLIMSKYIVLLVSLILHSSPQLHANGQGDIQVNPVDTVTLLNQVRSSSVSESGQRISNMNALVSYTDILGVRIV